MLFMGLTPTNWLGDYSISLHHCTCNEKTAEQAINGFASIAKYNTDWNWIMPVVEKIEQLGARIVIGFFFCEIKYIDPLNEQKNFNARMTSPVKIYSVNKAVSQFANWYNSNYGNTPQTEQEQPLVRCVDADEMPKILDFEREDFTEDELNSWIYGTETYLDNEHPFDDESIPGEHLYSLSLTDKDYAWPNETEEMPDTLRKKLDYMRKVMDLRDASYFRLR